MKIKFLLSGTPDQIGMRGNVTDFSETGGINEWMNKAPGGEFNQGGPAQVTIPNEVNCTPSSAISEINYNNFFRWLELLSAKEARELEPLDENLGLKSPLTTLSQDRPKEP